MRQKFAATTNSIKMLGCCSALILVVVIAALATGACVLLLVVMCVAMLGAMIWMVVGGVSRGTRGGEPN